MKNNDLTAQIAALLERSGLSPADAQAQARAAAENAENCGPGTGLGHIAPQEIGQFWQQAARAGRRRLVLEIVAEAQDLDADTGRVNITVLQAESWPEWTPEHAVQRGATDALLSASWQIDAPHIDVLTRPLHRGWDEIDTTTDTTPAHARAEELN